MAKLTAHRLQKLFAVWKCQRCQPDQKLSISGTSAKVVEKLNQVSRQRPANAVHYGN
ncbi:hypothetical protein ACNKHP_02085 [Shigella boydii]